MTVFCLSCYLEEKSSSSFASFRWWNHEAFVCWLGSVLFFVCPLFPSSSQFLPTNLSIIVRIVPLHRTRTRMTFQLQNYQENEWLTEFFLFLDESNCWMFPFNIFMGDVPKKIHLKALSLYLLIQKKIIRKGFDHCCVLSFLLYGTHVAWRKFSQGRIFRWKKGCSTFRWITSLSVGNVFYYFASCQVVMCKSYWNFCTIYLLLWTSNWKTIFENTEKYCGKHIWLLFVRE